MVVRAKLRKVSILFALSLPAAFNPGLASGASDLASLRSGLAQFALDTHDPAAALRYTRNAVTEAERLVRAKALLVTGSYQEAEGLLNELLEGQYYRGQAALLLAELAAGHGGNGVREYLETAAKRASGSARQKALYRLAEIEREAGHTDQAGKVLAAMEPGYWAALGYMNIAADYGRRDRNPSRALVALRVALAMSEGDVDSQRSQELRSRLLVRAGYLAYDHEDYEKAIGFLEKIPLESYRTPHGLYLHGLALSASGNQRAAMQSWHRAKKYPLAYPGVANAWLGTGRGYDLAGYLGQAGEAYLAANASYESERVTLRKLADQIRQKGAYQALVLDARNSEAQWFLADNRTLTQPRTAYLVRFIEQPIAQAAVNRVAELREMRQTLNQREDSLAVFRGAISERLGPPGHDVGGGPFNEEIEVLVQRLANLKARAISPAQQETLKGIARTLADLKASVGRFDGRLKKKDRELNELMTRTDHALERIRTVRRTANALFSRAESALDELALAYVEEQDHRMAFALDRTEQQIAHLYEYLALENLERGQP
ncbi:hypothetical protein [Marinobacter sp.]|uniref:hypothetical protein n=1 Tax=Marinobacter sp. TaxID=50741 RepID=UPI003BAAFAB4